jgi:two-component system sensor histidine kinase YesM
MAVRWDIDPALLDILVPKIILQPLIENAVYHGLKPKGGTGMIKIELRGDDASVFIKVSDDGVGMEAAELATLRTSFKDRSIGSEKIGLRNVNLRLLLLLGEDFELTVDSERGQGTTVRIRFPRIE